MVMKKSGRKWISSLILALFSLATFPYLGIAQENMGNLRGFVYGDDGKSPLKDAMVLIRNLTSLETYKSEKTNKKGFYEIKDIPPGSYAVGIQHENKDFNVNVTLEIKPKKQMACFTLPTEGEKPSYMIRCKEKKCFFILPIGWAALLGGTAAITWGVIEIIKGGGEEEVSPTR